MCDPVSQRNNGRNNLCFSGSRDFSRCDGVMGCPVVLAFLIGCCYKHTPGQARAQNISEAEIERLILEAR